MAYLRGMAVTRHFGHPQRTSPLHVVQAALTRRAVLYCPPPRKYAGYPVADDLLSMLRASEPTRETKLHTSPLRHLCGLRSSEKQTEHGSLGPCCSALSLSLVRSSTSSFSPAGLRWWFVVSRPSAPSAAALHRLSHSYTTSARSHSCHSHVLSPERTRGAVRLALRVLLTQSCAKTRQRKKSHLFGSRWCMALVALAAAPAMPHGCAEWWHGCDGCDLKRW